MSLKIVGAKVTTALVLSSLAMGLTSCSPGNNTVGSTVAGSAAGGLLGAALFPHSGFGIVGGALLGGIIGNQIGQSMDRRDHRNLQRAIVYTPVGQSTTWTNRRRHVTYTVRPVKAYTNRQGRYCRRYKTTVMIDGKRRTAYGRACRMANNQWKVVR